MSSKSNNQVQKCTFVNPYANPVNIGRRTGLDIKAGKNIRKDSDGYEDFDDYWTDSDTEKSDSVVGWVNLHLKHSGEKAKVSSKVQVVRVSDQGNEYSLRSMQSFTPSSHGDVSAASLASTASHVQHVSHKRDQQPVPDIEKDSEQGENDSVPSNAPRRDDTRDETAAQVEPSVEDSHVVTFSKTDRTEDTTVPEPGQTVQVGTRNQSNNNTKQLLHVSNNDATMMYKSQNTLNFVGNGTGTITRADKSPGLTHSQIMRESPASAVSSFRTRKRLTYSTDAPSSDQSAEVLIRPRRSTVGSEPVARPRKSTLGSESVARPRRSPLGSEPVAKSRRSTWSSSSGSQITSEAKMDEEGFLKPRTTGRGTRNRNKLSTDNSSVEKSVTAQPRRSTRSSTNSPLAVDVASNQRPKRGQPRSTKRNSSQRKARPDSVDAEDKSGDTSFNHQHPNTRVEKQSSVSTANQQPSLSPTKHPAVQTDSNVTDSEKEDTERTSHDKTLSKCRESRQSAHHTVSGSLQELQSANHSPLTADDDNYDDNDAAESGEAKQNDAVESPMVAETSTNSPDPESQRADEIPPAVVQENDTENSPEQDSDSVFLSLTSQINRSIVVDSDEDFEIVEQDNSQAASTLKPKRSAETTRRKSTETEEPVKDNKRRRSKNLDEARSGRKTPAKNVEASVPMDRTTDKTSSSSKSRLKLKRRTPKQNSQTTDSESDALSEAIERKRRRKSKRTSFLPTMASIHEIDATETDDQSSGAKRESLKNKLETSPGKRRFSLVENKSEQSSSSTLTNTRTDNHKSVADQELSTSESTLNSSPVKEKSGKKRTVPQKQKRSSSTFRSKRSSHPQEESDRQLGFEKGEVAAEENGETAEEELPLFEDPGDVYSISPDENDNTITISTSKAKGKKRKKKGERPQLEPSGESTNGDAVVLGTLQRLSRLRDRQDESYLGSEISLPSPKNNRGKKLAQRRLTWSLIKEPSSNKEVFHAATVNGDMVDLQASAGDATIQSLLAETATPPTITKRKGRGKAKGLHASLLRKKKKTSTIAKLTPDQASLAGTSPKDLDNNDSSIVPSLKKPKRKKSILVAGSKSKETVSNKRVSIAPEHQTSFFSPLPATPSSTPRSILKRLSMSEPRMSTGSLIHAFEVTQSQTPEMYQPKTVRIVHPEINENDANLRRSQRTRVKPLDWFRNERIIYERRKSGLVIAGVNPPTLTETEVQRQKHRGKLKLRKNKRLKEKVDGKRKQQPPPTPRNMSIHGEVPEEAEVLDTSTLPVLNPETDEEMLIECVKQKDKFQYMGPTGKEVQASDPLVICKMLSQKAFSVGQLILRPLQEKPMQYVRNDTMVFIIQFGKLAVTIHTKCCLLETSDIFFVPKGNTYSLKNLRDEEAKLWFFQHKG